MFKRTFLKALLQNHFQLNSWTYCQLTFQEYLRFEKVHLHVRFCSSIFSAFLRLHRLALVFQKQQTAILHLGAFFETKVSLYYIKRNEETHCEIKRVNEPLLVETIH
jgi:dihydroorotase